MEEEIEKPQPYLEKMVLVTGLWNPDYPEDKKCVCGHPYYRHFDTYTEHMDAVGCKYCPCYTFVEALDE